MKKFFSILAAVLFSGSMMAAEVVYVQTIFNAENNSGKVSVYTNTWTNTTDGFTVNIVNANNNNNNWKYIKMGSKSAASVGSISSANAIDAAVTKVVVTVDEVTASKINSFKLYISSNGTEWSEKGSFTVAAGAQEVAIEQTNQAKNLYYKVEVDCAQGSKNGLITISKLEFYAESAPGFVGKPTIAGEESFYETAEISIACSTEGANVYYTLDGAEPTAESALYAAPFVINATTTVKAIAIKGEDKSDVAEKTFTKGTVLTVAQALDLDLSTPVANQYVKGIVSKVESFNSNYGSITYWISDNGEQANELEVYAGLAMNGGKFEAQDDLAVGDKVVVFGTLKDFKGTKEFDKNNYLVAFERADIVVTNCDWENIEWLGDGSPEQTFGNQFKVCKDGEQPGVVNIQKPGWAAETGIYLTFPSAAFGEISLPENNYVKDGAGIVFYLSAFTAKETEVTVMCDSNEIIFTVYNDKGTDEATALINTKPEVKAVKTVINGQVVIIRDGKMINVLGVQL